MSSSPLNPSPLNPSALEPSAPPSTLRTGVLRVEGAAEPVAGLLPILHGLPARVAEDAEAADPEMRRGLGYGRPHTLLPYTAQDGYDRSRTTRELPTVVLENEELTATFLPGYGGGSGRWCTVPRAANCCTATRSCNRPTSPCGTPGWPAAWSGTSAPPGTGR